MRRKLRQKQKKMAEAEADEYLLKLVQAAQHPFHRGDSARGGYDATSDRLEGP